MLPEPLPGADDDDPVRMHAVDSWLPTGVRGDCRVVRYTVTDMEARNLMLRALLNPHRNPRVIPPGEYTQLWEGDTLWMSDTPGEVQDHSVLFQQATGRVLLHGLGLGMAAKRVMGLREVQHVTIVERSQDVLDLVAPHLLRAVGQPWEETRVGDHVVRYDSPAATILQGDAFEWSPRKTDHWDLIWHDIWPNLSTDNLVEMRALGNRFKRYADRQLHWGQDELRRISAQNKWRRGGRKSRASSTS